MRAGNNHILGASIPQHTHRARDSATGINHVIQQHRGLTRNITHHAVRHHLVSNLGRPGLMYKRQRGITQNIRPLLGHLHPAGIGGNHHHVLQRIIGLNIIRQNRHGMHVIHRTIKKALNLIGVQIHRHNPIRPGGLQQVSNQPGGNRLPPPVLLILPGIRIKRQNSGDVLRGTPLQRINHNELLHQPLIQRLGVGLDDESITTTDGLFESDKDFTIGKIPGNRWYQFDTKLPGNRFAKLRVGATREQHEMLLSVAPLIVSHIYLP